MPGCSLSIVTWPLLKVLLPSCLIINSTLKPQGSGLSTSFTKQYRNKMLPELEGDRGRKNLTFQETSPHGAGERGLGFGGGKNQVGETQNKINTHKSKVIHGHWHQDREQHSEPGVIHSGSRLCARRQGVPEGNGLSVWKRRDPALALYKRPLLISQGTALQRTSKVGCHPHLCPLTPWLTEMR